MIIPTDGWHFVTYSENSSWWAFWRDGVMKLQIEKRYKQKPVKYDDINTDWAED